jgi:hypothetical protein
MNVSHRRVDYKHVENSQIKAVHRPFKSVCGCGVIAPLIPNFLRYALKSKWDGHQSRSESFGEKSLAPAQYLTTSHRMSTSYPRRYKEYHVPTTENQQLGAKSFHVERPNHLRLHENLLHHHHHQQQQQQPTADSPFSMPPFVTLSASSAELHGNDGY